MVLNVVAICIEDKWPTYYNTLDRCDKVQQIETFKTDALICTRY